MPGREFAAILVVVALAVGLFLWVSSGAPDYECPAGTRMVWLRYQGRACVVDPIPVRRRPK